MKTKRDELLQYVAINLSNARSVNDIIATLQSYKGLEAYEMMYCIALSSVLNGVELDRRTEQQARHNS